MADLPPSPWLIRPQTRPGADVVEAAAASADTAREPPAPPPFLVCFGPAGASAASAFFGWERALPPEVELLLVELPGRGARMREAPLTSMQALLAALLDGPEGGGGGGGLLPALRARPFVLFGHSMGAWVAAALACELAARGGPLPLKLYASANRSPVLAGTEHDVHPVVMHRLAASDPGGFWQAFEERYGPNPSLEHPAVRRLLLPTLAADFQLIETWNPLRGTGPAPAKEAAGGGPAAAAPALRLPCPLAALGARGDRRYTAAQLGAWRACAPGGSSEAFEERWFEGGHSYVTSEGPGRTELLQWLAADLQALLAAHAASQGGGQGQRAESPGGPAQPAPAAEPAPLAAPAVEAAFRAPSYAEVVAAQQQQAEQEQEQERQLRPPLLAWLLPCWR